MNFRMSKTKAAEDCPVPQKKAKESEDEITQQLTPEEQTKLVRVVF